MIRYQQIQVLTNRIANGLPQPEARSEIEKLIKTALEHPHDVGDPVSAGIEEPDKHYDYNIPVLRGIADLTEHYDTNIKPEGDPPHDSQIQLLRKLASLHELAGDSYSHTDPLRSALEALHTLAHNIRPDNRRDLFTLRTLIIDAASYCLNDGYHELGEEVAKTSSALLEMCRR